nr:MAG TPA: hypothetical protein [Caudoviricetes sp.]
MWVQKLCILSIDHSSQGFGVGRVPVSTLAGIPSMMVISGSMLIV